MKTFSKFITASVLLSFASCSSDINEFDVTIPDKTSSKEHISLQEAIDMANSYFNLSRSEDGYEIDYIISKPSNAPSRSTQANDTLAYVVNRKDKPGFFIVSYPSIERSILAYSDEANFEYAEDEEDIVYSNFIQRLDDYLMNPNEYANPSNTFPFNPIIPQQTQVYPMLHVPMGPTSPYDSYVIQDHHGCPVGCVAVATAQIMAHTRTVLYDYHNEDFQLLEMIKAFSPWRVSDLCLQNQTSIYTRAEAVDRFAKLLYYIGPDVHMTYSIGSSSASSFYAYQLLYNLGYDIKENDLTTYSDVDVACSLIDGYLIYARGSGHAWVIDGANWEIQTEENDGPQSRTDSNPQICNVYVHCDWGWGGSCNGYFNGQVFNVAGHSFGNLEYFSVKKEY